MCKVPILRGRRAFVLCTNEGMGNTILSIPFFFYPLLVKAIQCFVPPQTLRLKLFIHSYTNSYWINLFFYNDGEFVHFNFQRKPCEMWPELGQISTRYPCLLVLLCGPLYFVYFCFLFLSSSIVLKITNF